MTNTKQQGKTPATKPVDQQNSSKPKIRDTPDSRKNEEQESKGDDVTHNTKKTERTK